MTEIAQTYLGNINDNLDLAELLATETCLQVYLNYSDRSRGRIHAQTDAGITVGIIKSRDRSLRSGDLFKTNSQKLLLINLQEQELLILDFSATKTNYLPTHLVNIGYILGNHHCPIAIEEHKVYLHIANNTVVKKAIEDLQIPGLKIYYEMSSIIPQTSHSTHQH